MKRYPLGLPAWGFWVLAVLAAGLIGQVPAIGGGLSLLGIAAALVWFFFKVRSERDRRYSEYAPVPVTGSQRLVMDRLEVVGESQYLIEISRAVGIAGRELEAVLAWEPKNPHAVHGAAIRVDLIAEGQRFTCGYVPSQLSSGVLPLVREAADRGLSPMLDATVFGGTPSKPNYGVWLGSGVRPNNRVRFS